MSGLLGLDDWWKEHWRGMPEFVQEDLSPWRTVEVRVAGQENLGRFLQSAGSKLYHNK